MTRTVLVASASAALMAMAGAAHAQTAPDYTSDLNAMPARPAATPAPTPQPVPQPQAQPAPVAATPPRPQAQPAPAPSAVVVPSPAPAVATAPAPAPAAPAAPRVLTRGEIAALPFAIGLPEGYVLTAGRAGPDFQVWTVRKGGMAQLMIYAGPSSQFPYHEGEMVDAGGRTTVVVIEDGRRRALEHLFRQSMAPNHIHVWIASVDGADRDQAEAIGHGVSPR